MAPSARGLRPQAVGERTVRLSEIFRAMARLSPSAPSGHLPRRGRFFDGLKRLPFVGSLCILWQVQNIFIGAAALGYLGQFPGFYKAFDAAVDQLVADAEVALGKNFADEPGSQEAASGGFA